MSDLPMRLLAVVGGAAVGAFGTGALVKLVARLTMTRKKLPAWMLRLLRVLGAITLGWLAALWMFGSGFGGFGGPGGWGFGPGTGMGDGSTSIVPKEREKEKISEPGPEPVDVAESLQVEVLGPDAIKRLAGENANAADRRYRVDTGKGQRLLTLPELKDFLRGRQQGEHPLRQVIVVLYRDSPERRTGVVADLKRWVEEDLPPRTKGDRILVNIDLRGQNAPAK